MGKVGLTEHALYLVRPDGYVALVDPGANAATLAQRIEANLLRTTPHVVPAPPEVAALG